MFEVPQMGHYSAASPRGHRSAGAVLRALMCGEVSAGRRERYGWAADSPVMPGISGRVEP